MPNHRTLYEAVPGPRELAPGADIARNSSSQATAPNGDKVDKILTFHRGSYVIDVALRRHQRRHRADRAVRVFPAVRDTEDAGRAQLDGAGVVSSGR